MPTHAVGWEDWRRWFHVDRAAPVIVILGVLSTVTVFAVRGITDKGQENSCAVELRNLSTAQEQNWALTGSYAAERRQPGDLGELDFVDMVNAAPATSRRLAFVNLDEFASTEEVRNAMNTSRNNGLTTFAIYPDDDPGAVILTYLTGEVGGPNEELVLVDVFGGPNQTLLELMASIG